MLDFEAILTNQTCGDACWKAREDICRCSCAGENHGIYRRDPSAQVQRTRRIRGGWYALVAVAPDVESVREYIAQANAERGIEKFAPSESLGALTAWQDTEGREHSRRIHDHFAVRYHHLYGREITHGYQYASKAQMKWPEVAAVKPTRNTPPLLLWEPITKV